MFTLCACDHEYPVSELKTISLVVSSKSDYFAYLCVCLFIYALRTAHKFLPLFFSRSRTTKDRQPGNFERVVESWNVRTYHKDQDGRCNGLQRVRKSCECLYIHCVEFV